MIGIETRATIDSEVEASATVSFGPLLVQKTTGVMTRMGVN